MPINLKYYFKLIYRGFKKPTPSTTDVIVHFPDTQIFCTNYPVTCKVYTGYHATSNLEHGSSTCTVDNPLANARGLSLITGGQTMIYLSLDVHSNFFNSHLPITSRFVQTIFLKTQIFKLWPALICLCKL